MKKDKKIDVVGIGANVCDTLIVLPAYTEEDKKQKADSVGRAGGGPCGTGLVAAAKLGCSAAYIGQLSTDADGVFLKQDFEAYGVSTEHIRIRDGYQSFVSFVMLSQASGSRTIVFDRGTLPPTVLDEAQKQAIRDAGVLLVDGNDLAAAIEGATVARESGTIVVYDAGGLYEGVENLLPLVDYLIPSEEFALKHTGCDDAQDAARVLFERYHPRAVVITQGSRGGVFFDGKCLRAYPVMPAHVVDSNGAGDVFHGAYTAALTRGYDAYTACLFSSAVSALKCEKIGSRAGVPDLSTTLQFLKEQGYEL